MTPRVMALIASGVLNLVLLCVVACYQDRLAAAWRRLNRCPGECGLSMGGDDDDAA